MPSFHPHKARACAHGTWTHALHATRFNCLTLSLYHLEVGRSFYPCVLFLWPIACVYA